MESKQKEFDEKGLSLTKRADELLAILYDSPSEKVVDTARELERVFKAWRSLCCDTMISNLVGVVTTISEDLKQFGVILEPDESQAREDSANGQ